VQSKVLSDLLAVGAVTITSTPNLVEKLIAGKHTDLLVAALGNVTDITEDMLVQVLQYALDQEHSALVLTVFSYQSNFVFLKHATLELSVDNVVSTLGYLSDLLELFWDSPDQELRISNEENTSILSVGNVVSWTAMLVDGHFAALVIQAQAPTDSEKLQTLFSNLAAVTKDSADLSTKLLAVDGALGHLESVTKDEAKNKRDQRAVIGDYCVEFLQL
jgi:hypothetical protein